MAAFVASLALRARSAENHASPAKRMAGCPATPNCVSSLSKDPASAIEPLTIDGDAVRAWQHLRQVVQALPRTKIRVDESAYLAAECRSRLFGFIDDLEFSLDPTTNVIHIRSAARVGYSDLGVNRRRAEQVQQAFDANAR